MAAGLLFTMVFFVRGDIVPHNGFLFPAAQIIMFSDLECDYINPIDLCNRLNQVRGTLISSTQNIFLTDSLPSLFYRKT